MLCAWILNQKYLWLNDFYLWISLIWSKNGLTWLNIVLHSFNIPLFLHHVELTKICMKKKEKEDDTVESPIRFVRYIVFPCCMLEVHTA